MARQKRGPDSIGLISDDPSHLAERIHAQLAYGDRIVWACERGRVYAVAPEVAPPLSMHAVAGTYRLGQAFDDLVDDLRCLRESLRNDWILDDVPACAHSKHA